MQPINDKVVVSVQEPEEKIGEIYVPSSAQGQEGVKQGTVVAVGPGVMLENGERFPCVVKEGDLVLFGKYAGTEITVRGEDYTVLGETEILVVL